MNGDKKLRRKICKDAGSSFEDPKASDIAGIAISTTDLQPIYGVRLKESEGESGWYIWGGDRSDNPDFFQPLHIEHVKDFFPIADKFLALSSGYKFIADNTGYQDVWFESEE